MDIGFVMTLVMVFSVALIEVVVLMWSILMSSFMASRQRGFATTIVSGMRLQRNLCQPKSRRKPDWVVTEIIHLAALMPSAGCRTIALTFARLHAIRRQMTVGKTFVSNTLREHQYQIRDLRRQFKHRRPYESPVNRTWGVDMTGKGDVAGKCHNILGIIDHGSRRALTLTVLPNAYSCPSRYSILV
jgi:hypothetical protein